MRVISFLAQETRDTVAIDYVSPTIETVIHQTLGDEGSLATKPTYEYVQLFSGQSSDGSPRLRQSQVRRPRPFGRATHTIRSMEQKDVLKALQRDHAAELKLAAKRLKGTARHTEIIPSRTLSELTGHEILLKPENLQVTGSFKIRGAYNKIASLSEEQIARGIVTASAGNHAQGVAYAARERHAKATICMPQITPPLKVDATKAYGADVVLYGEVFDESAARAQELSDKEGMIYVPPFDDYEVICGQGTIGLEILDQLPDLDAVIVPVGGGGLISGVAFAIKSLRPEVKVYGVQAEGAPSMYRSLHEHKYQTLKAVSTFADGIQVKTPGELTYQICEQYVDDIVTVSEDETAAAILSLMENQKLVAEGAGAVPVAAVLFHKLPVEGKKVACVVSGGNIDVNILNRVITRGLVMSGRKANMTIALEDKPGQLKKVAEIVSRCGSNVVSVQHDGSDPNMPISSCFLKLTLETRDAEQIEQIRAELAKEGFQLVSERV